MAELTREDFQTAFKEQSRQSEQHSRDQLSAINGLANEIRGMTTAISEQRTPLYGRNGRNGNGIWPILFGVGALVFGLMAPMYIIVKTESDHIHVIDQKMVSDDERERETAVDIARLSSSLLEVETQFGIVNERLSEARIKLIEDDQLVTAQTIETAVLKERISHLENNSVAE